MNLQTMRDLVRAQLDLDDTDLPDALLDAYLQEGYDRVLELEHRWPFMATSWPITALADGTATSPLDVRVIEMLTDSAGRLLTHINPRLALMSYPPGNTTTATPRYWTERNGGIAVMPPPGSTYILTGYGFRGGSTWVLGGASTECDCDRRLHMSICWYACSLGYAQQEDEVLEQTYLNRFKETSAQARDAIMRAWTGTPKRVAYTHYPQTLSGPGGPAQLVINVPPI